MSKFWRITVRELPDADGVPGEIRMRRLLKRLNRLAPIGLSLGFECVNIETVETRGNALPATDTDLWPKFRKDRPCEVPSP